MGFGTGVGKRGGGGRNGEVGGRGYFFGTKTIQHRWCCTCTMVHIRAAHKISSILENYNELLNLAVSCGSFRLLVTPIFEFRNQTLPHTNPLHEPS